MSGPVTGGAGGQGQAGQVTIAGRVVGVPMPRLPRALGLLAVIALAIAANRYWPGVVPAVLGLVLLYVLVTHGDRALALVGMAPAGLRRAYRPAS